MLRIYDEVMHAGKPDNSEINDIESIMSS